MSCEENMNKTKENLANAFLNIAQSEASIVEEQTIKMIVKAEPEREFFKFEHNPLNFLTDNIGKHIKSKTKYLLYLENQATIKNVFLDHSYCTTVLAPQLCRSKEDISTQTNAVIKVETNDEEMDEITFNNWKIKSEELYIKEELKESDSSISPDSVSQDSQSKFESGTPNRNDTYQISPNDNLLNKPNENDHCGLKTVRKNSSKEREYKQNRKKHVLQYGNTKRVFKCDQCSYNTSAKLLLNRHLLQHGNRDAKVFKCDFQTLQKDSFKKPQVLHNNPGKVKKLKCKECDYQTRYYTNFKRHKLRHNNPEEVEAFKCNECDFQTIHKNSLRRHQLLHNNSEGLKKFKCTKCDFQTIHKYNIKGHQLMHNNREKFEKFKSNKWDFQLKHKQNLKRQEFCKDNTEKNKKFTCYQYDFPKEVNNFKCNKCDFQTLYKYSLKGHQLLHKQPEEVERFQCYKCDFQTIYKSSMRGHQIMHKKPDEVEAFKCNKCNFQTKYKANIKQHQLRHTGPYRKLKRLNVTFKLQFKEASASD